MQFVVSEQLTTDTATVHQLGCRKAQAQERKDTRTRVHGPFVTGDQAKTAAVRTGRRTVAFCISCKS